MARNSFGFWLVETNPTTRSAEVQRYPRGQSPLEARFNRAVYLGPTPQDAAKYMAKAARQLRVPNPQKVPSAGTSLGILGSILAGFAPTAGVVAGDIGAAGTAAGAAGADTGAGAASSGATGAGADAGSGASGAAAGAGSGAAAGNLGSGMFGKVLGSITSPLDFLMFIAWIFHPRNILRAVEFLTGMVVMIFGFWAALQARGERGEGFSTGEAAISRSGLGRVARALAANSRVESAPHRTRRSALRQRYQREENLRRRQRRNP